MSDQIADLVAKVAKLEGQLANMVVHGTVKEYKDGKFRVIMGKDKDDKEVLSPWYDSGSHRGFLREETPVVEGQNMTVFCPNGDWAQATVVPYGPNTSNKNPDNRADDAMTQQIGDVKITRKKDQTLWEYGDKVKITWHKDYMKFTNDKSEIHMEKEKITYKVDDHEIEQKKSGTDYIKGVLRHAMQKVGPFRKFDSTHKHGGVEPGGAITDVPEG